MKKQLAATKKELRILCLNVDTVIDMIEGGEVSRYYIMHELHDIYVRLETLINKVNIMQVKQSSIEVLNND